MSSSGMDTPFLKQSVIFSEDQSQLYYNLTKFSTDVGSAVNIRDIAIYDLSEQVNGQQFFVAGDSNSSRYAFRQVYNTGALVVGNNDFPTGIDGATYFTRIYGTAQTSTTSWRPLPFVATGAITDQITMVILNVGPVQTLRIVVGATATLPTDSIVVLEYLKQ